MLMDKAKQRVLIVDDNTENLNILFRVLTDAGLIVLVAQSGQDALDLLQEVLPDLILLDVMMPDINGFDMCRRIKQREQTRDIPVLFLSASEDTVDKLTGFSAGGVDYITKPFHEQEVLARVATHLDLRQAQQMLQEQTARLQEMNRNMIREIAERKQAEESLKKAKNAAETANKAKSEFLATMSHELRTPLHAILGFSQTLSHSPHFDPEERKNLDIIHRSGKHLLTLLNDILEMSKIEAGQSVLHEQTCDLERLLHEVGELFLVKAGEKNLAFAVTRDTDIPRYIRTDAGKLRQVLINLLGNAIKFTHEGRVSVSVKTVHEVHKIDEVERGDTHILLFEIEDTGQGIASDELESLFDPFVQNETARQTQGGTGLGLSISQRFVQMMGGELTVESEIDRGTKVTFRIQTTVLTEAEASTDTSAPLAVMPRNDLGPPTGRHVLTPEDLEPLSPDLLTSLEQAALQGDTDGFKALIADIRPYYAEIADALAALVEDFDYQTILTLLRHSDGECQA